MADKERKPGFYLITPMRSDAVLVYKGLDNGPTQEQLTKTKNNGVFTWYQEIDIHESTHLDWRRKLGGLYASELHRKLKADGNLPAVGPFAQATINPEEFVLVAFPDNYRLFEHRRATSLDNTGVRSSSDRRDVYLYGHPQGNRKRFRSPADFYPHLVWLMNATTTDHENCACKLCTTEEYHKIAQKVRDLQDEQNRIAETKPPANGVKPVDAPPHPPPPPPPAQSPAAVSTAPSTSAQSTSAPTVPPQPKPTPTPTPIPQPMAQKPVPPVKPRNADQQLDQQMNKFLYRVGELAWFTNPEQNLSLVAVVSRELRKKGDLEKAAYLLQPISHPFDHLPARIETDESRITPWLAYSTPACQRSGPPELTYDQVDWGSLRNRFPSYELVYDGSIRAANMVDSTYTVVEPLSSSVSNAAEVEYNGIYLGAEFIWAGEAVRLQTNGENQDMMVVSKIIEKKGNSGAQSDDVEFIGDVYSSAEANHKPERPMPPNQYLPLRVREDLKHRNEYQVKILGTTTYWKLIEAQQRVSISSVKGRWYESCKILPIAAPQVWNESRRSGRIPDGTERFNTRGPTQNGEVGNKVPLRQQAFSRSLPPNITFGMPFPDKYQQRPPAMNQVPPQAQSNPPIPDPMADFVNMDSMDIDQNFLS